LIRNEKLGVDLNKDFVNVINKKDKNTKLLEQNIAAADIHL
jgi:hypothetical protein